ncbi:MAG: peptide chain release factor 1 [Clostridia bacterium]
MIAKLQAIKERYNEIGEKLSVINISTEPDTYKKLMKEYKDLTPLIEKYDEYISQNSLIKEAEEMLQDATLDAEFKELYEAQLYEGKDRLLEIENEIKVLLLPKDPDDDKNVIVEIRGGAGGDEAALFVNSLYRMYTMYAESKGYKTEILSSNTTELGGFKEVCFVIEGDGAYSRYKFESGVHRVQRVPETESSGRIHTSTVTVAVLPETEEVEFEINPTDLQIDTFRSSGAGGQHINKTESAIRITHLPTGTVVECQDERSQHKNKDKAMKILRSRIYEQQKQEQSDLIAKERKSQVGTGDRSERIRTYNYPQGRVTDHRISLTLYKLQTFLDGDLDEMIDAIITNQRAAQLTTSEE